MSEIARALETNDDFVERLAVALKERQKTSWDRWGVLIMLVVNGFALVWGASKLSAAVERNADTSSSNTILLRDVSRIVNDVEARMRVVEDRTERVP